MWQRNVVPFGQRSVIFSLFFLTTAYLSRVIRPSFGKSVSASPIKTFLCLINWIEESFWLVTSSTNQNSFLGGVQMIPGRLYSLLREFTLVRSRGSVLVSMISPENVTLERVVTARVHHPRFWIVVRISFRYDISQHYQVNEEEPLVDWNDNHV